jgi:hypothetical protein
VEPELGREKPRGVDEHLGVIEEARLAHGLQVVISLVATVDQRGVALPLRISPSLFSLLTSRDPAPSANGAPYRSPGQRPGCNPTTAQSPERAPYLFRVHRPGLNLSQPGLPSKHAPSEQVVLRTRPGSRGSVLAPPNQQ